MQFWCIKRREWKRERLSFSLWFQSGKLLIQMQSAINFMENHLLAARSLCLFRTSADEFSVLNLTLFSPSFQLILWLQFCVAFPFYADLPSASLPFFSLIYFNRGSVVVVTTPPPFCYLLLVFVARHVQFFPICAPFHILFCRAVFLFSVSVSPPLLFLATSMADVVVAAAQVNYATLAETTTSQTMRSEREWTENKKSER